MLWCQFFFLKVIPGSAFLLFLCLVFKVSVEDVYCERGLGR